MYKIIGADGKEYGPVGAEQIRHWIAGVRRRIASAGRAAAVGGRACRRRSRSGAEHGQGPGYWVDCDGDPEFASGAMGRGEDDGPACEPGESSLDASLRRPGLSTF